MLLTPEFRVRSLTSADIDQAMLIAEEQKLSFWSADGFHEHLSEKSNFAVALTSSNRVVSGFLIARLVPGRKDSPDAELLNLGVGEAYKRKQGGTLLMASFLEWCGNQGVDRIWLEVRVTNVAAQRFYARFDFKQTDRRRNFYTGPSEDAYVMCREVGGSGS